jgi:hypothetical protein
MYFYCMWTDNNSYVLVLYVDRPILSNHVNLMFLTLYLGLPSP